MIQSLLCHCAVQQIRISSNQLCPDELRAPFLEMLLEGAPSIMFGWYAIKSYTHWSTPEPVSISHF